MSELYEKSLLKLELDQVLQLLSQCAGSPGGRDACLQIHPISDLDDVKLMLDQMNRLSPPLTRDGRPSAPYALDIATHAEKHLR